MPGAGYARRASNTSVPSVPNTTDRPIIPPIDTIKI
jgi:hypothetical protein